jgi:hypothetical protein
MPKLKSLYGIYGLVLLCLILGQQTLFKISQSFESIQVNQQIKAKQLENDQLKTLIDQKQQNLNPQNQEMPLETLLENHALQVIQKNKNENILELTLAGSYPGLVAWLESLPGNRIVDLKLYEQQHQIWCEIRLRNVS